MSPLFKSVWRWLFYFETGPCWIAQAGLGLRSLTMFSSFAPSALPWLGRGASCHEHGGRGRLRAAGPESASQGSLGRVIDHSQPRELNNEVAFASHSREERAWSEACWGEDLDLDDFMGAVEWPQRQ